MAKLDGKIALVTGGNSGIGLASAKQFVNEGAYVFITGRRDRELAAAIKEIGRNVTGVQGDVANLSANRTMPIVLLSSCRCHGYADERRWRYGLDVDASHHRLVVPGANSLAAAARSSVRRSAARFSPSAASNRACACDQPSSA